jgi:cephalosporin hydroxylase
MPATIVPPEQSVTFAALADRVIATRTQHADLLQRYHQVWYECGHTWPYTHFLGVGLMKCPNDLWIYQALMTDARPRTVIETGTYKGGSALWFAYLMDMLGIDGRVISIDIENFREVDHPRIAFIEGDSTDPALAASICAEVEGPVLVCLDADHAAAFVRRVMDLYAPACQVGDWLIVEDTNIEWIGEHGDRGARGGVADYLTAHPGEFRQDVLCERYLLTMNPGGWLQRVAPCGHGDPNGRA